MTDTSKANPALVALDEAERRITELEIKASFADDLLEELNRVVARQQQQIDKLQRELAEMRRQMPDPGNAAPFRSLRDELPPHY